MSRFEQLQNNETFQRTFSQGELTLGLFLPVDAYPSSLSNSSLNEQIERVQRVERAGFTAIWARDIPLHDPSFGDAGQTYDPLVYLSFLAAHTKTIGLGIGSLILPIRHPIHLAQMTASVQHLSNNRLLLGVASGDRPVEFPAFQLDASERGERFRESFETMRQLWVDPFPVLQNDQTDLRGRADSLPKPEIPIPLFVTGNSRQTLEWIGEQSDGWMYYPRNVAFQQRVVREWREQSDDFKPFLQSLYIDLSDDPDEAPTPIHLGFRSGRLALIQHLEQLRTIGVNHVILNMKYSSRPVDDVLEELETYVLPHFSAND